MATSMCRAWISRSIKVVERGISFSARKQLLSEAYSCREAWKKRLESPIIKNVSLSEFCVEVREHFDKEKRSSLVDMDILANKLDEMETSDADFIEDLLRSFRRSKDGVPVCDSIIHGVIRAYLELHLDDRLLDMIKDRVNYGIFPDSYAASVLLDHFIKKENYAGAARIAYEMMLQEDFSHPTTHLLSLLAVTKHVTGTSLADLIPEPQPEDDSEEDWKRVKVIRFPYYDDHFDIKDERFLLGKTLYMVAQNLQYNTAVRNSLQVIGLGLHQKFGKALLLLDEIAGSGQKNAILEEALIRFAECIENAETREAEIKEKDFGLLTVDDEIYKLRLTQEAKEELTTEFEETAHKLRWNNQVSEESLLPLVESFVTAEVPKFEAADIAVQVELFSQWEARRAELVEAALKQHLKEEKMCEIEQKLKELQEKEELLRFFEMRDKIVMAKERAPAIPPPKEEDDDETLRAKRIKRRKYRHHV